MQLTKSPCEFTTDSSVNPYYVSSVSVMDNKFIHTLKMNTPMWSEDAFTFQYVRISLDYFFQKIKALYSYTSINYDNSFKDLTSFNPIATRYLSPNGYFLVERPPFRTTLRFTPARASVARGSDKSIERDVWIPWQVYVIGVDLPTSKLDMRIFFNNKPLSSLEDKVPYAWTPNLFANGGVCWGDDTAAICEELRELEAAGSLSNRKIFDILSNRYWSGGWNADIIPSGSFLPAFLSDSTHKEFPDDKDQALALSYKIKAVKAKHRNSLMRSYVQSLNIWSEYSLSDLLHMMGSISPSRYALSELYEHAPVSAFLDHNNPTGNISKLLENYFANSHKFPVFLFDNNDQRKYLHVDIMPSDLGLSDVYNLNNYISQESARDMLEKAINKYALPSYHHPQLTIDTSEEPF